LPLLLEDISLDIEFWVGSLFPPSSLDIRGLVPLSTGLHSSGGIVFTSLLCFLYVMNIFSLTTLKIFLFTIGFHKLD
jgi:hypothetical protein